MWGGNDCYSIDKKKVAPGDETLLEELYREMRSKALNQKGSIGAETLKRVGVAGEILIISKWQHIDDWSKWLVSQERRAYQEQIDSLTSSETKFEIYVH